MALIDDAKRPQADRPPLQDNPARKYGPQRAALAVCAKHGEAHPLDEPCPYCEPVAATAYDDDDGGQTLTHLPWALGWP